VLTTPCDTPLALCMTAEARARNTRLADTPRHSSPFVNVLERPSFSILPFLLRYGYLSSAVLMPVSPSLSLSPPRSLSQGSTMEEHTACCDAWAFESQMHTCECARRTRVGIHTLLRERILK
jgi:hypothetical protein